MAPLSMGDRQAEGDKVVTVITLPFPPSTNNLFLNGRKGRFRSQKYDTWLQEAGWELKRQRPSKVAGPVSVKYEFGKPDNRRRDLSNLIKAPEDLLVSYGVIESDDSATVQLLFAEWSEEVQGVRITVESVASE